MGHGSGFCRAVHVGHVVSSVDDGLLGTSEEPKRLGTGNARNAVEVQFHKRERPLRLCRMMLSVLHAQKPTLWPLPLRFALDMQLRTASQTWAGDGYVSRGAPILLVGGGGGNEGRLSTNRGPGEVGFSTWGGGGGGASGKGLHCIENSQFFFNKIHRK